MVCIRNVVTGETNWEGYDHLVLSTGAVPVRPALPGIDLANIFALRGMEDMDRINDWLSSRSVRSAVVVGGGFAGLEIAEQLHRRGVTATVIDSSDHLLKPFDVEMTAPIVRELENHGVKVVLEEAVAGFLQLPGKRIAVTTDQGTRYVADIVILSIGVRPLSDLARSANLELGPGGAVVVNDYLQTSDPNIWAVGDCVQLKHRVSGRPVHVPLAGPANRGGRLIADNILGVPRPFRGPLGTSVIRVFELTAACTGLSEKTLQDLDIPYRSVHLHPNAHAKYFPGSEPVAIKLLFDPWNGRILGAQATGKRGVEKRIDVIATAIAGNLSVEELTDLDLCYAPPYGTAKDPVNMAGMAASNIRGGLVESISWNQIPADTGDVTILDVRNKPECERGVIPHSIQIPLPELRERLGEVPKHQPVIVYCHSGQRSYVACRILAQKGYLCKNLSGSYATWSAQPHLTAEISQENSGRLALAAY
jgi:NADPH-dependent 2,4-dienoyl-CoA reductase/sulfur reductase-like enzyme/rhodanese-related sulfurtransferase